MAPTSLQMHPFPAGRYGKHPIKSRAPFTSPTFIKSLLVAAGGLHVRAQACPYRNGHACGEQKRKKCRKTTESLWSQMTVGFQNSVPNPAAKELLKSC